MEGIMSRVQPAPAEQYEPLFGVNAPLRQRIYAQAPHIAGPYLEFMTSLRKNSRLPGRMVELLRLRISFHNQCRSCMAIRYSDGLDDGITEGLVCSLEKPQEADDLTAAEKAALAFADKMATDHLSVSDDTFAELRKHFTEPEIMELAFQVATFVGYGRMGSALAMTDDLPAEYSDPDAILAPWRQTPQEVV
jgi:alkylhydroperoxidase family enzyme